jgi:hypothetical protein
LLRALLFGLALLSAPLAGPAASGERGVHWTAWAGHLIETGQFEQARRIATRVTAGSEEERLIRAWIIAVAYMRENRPREAIAHLEEFVTRQPGDVTARLELAHAYFLVRDDEKAEFHFTQALSGRISEDLAEAARWHLRQIEARRRVWSGNFHLALVPETNAVKRTRAEYVEFGGLRWRLNSDARHRGGVGVSVGAGVVAAPHLAPFLRGEFGVAVRAKVNRDSELNDYAVSLRAGLNRRFGDTRIGGGLRGEYRHLGGSSFRREYGPFLTFDHTLRDGTSVFGRFDVMRREHYRTPRRDGHLVSATIGINHALDPQTWANAKIGVTRTTGRDDRFSSTGVSLGGGITRAFEGGIVLGLDVELGHERWETPDYFFREVRRDWTASVTGRVLHRNLQWRGYAPFLEVTHERAWSNIPLNEFDNTRLNIGVSRRF